MRVPTCVATFAGTASAEIDDQVAQGGTGGGAKFRSPTYVATAGCTSDAGESLAIERELLCAGAPPPK